MKHHLSDEHPLQPIRVKLAVDLIKSTGLIELAHLVPPRSATIDELHLVHSTEYVDVHHGDGVEEIFQSDPEVLTISLHESGRWLFPGTGFPQDAGTGAGKGYAANLPFYPFTWDEPWLMAFDRVVPPLLRRFKPTVLVTQDGCDTHHLDPLAHLAATTRIWPRIGKAFHQLAHELCEGRWLALGGGGYAIYEVVPRAWTLLFAEMVERPDLAAEVDDPVSVEPQEEAQERVWTALRKDLTELGKVHGLDFSLSP